MNDQGTDRAALRKALIDGCEAAGVVSMRSRSPAELGDQLERDATSLELTGASFSKDEAFYKAVAANLREAVVRLRDWQPQFDMLRLRHALKCATEIEGTRLLCATAACDVRELMPEALGSDRAAGWRAAADAIRQIILAGPSEPGPSERRATPEAGQ